MTRFSDEQLMAYLDGEWLDEEHQAIERTLACDKALAKRLRSLELPLHDIQTAFDALLADVPRFELPCASSSTRCNSTRLSSTRPWRWPALAASLFAVGLLLGTFWNQLPAQETVSDWKMAVANYQVLYVADTLAGQPPQTQQMVDQLSVVSNRLGHDLSSASVVEGLAFRRAQILGLDDQPLIQIAYMSGYGEPIALCITPVEEAAYAPKPELLAGLAASHWVSNGMGYVVIGGDNLDLVQRVANGLRGRI